VSALFSASRRDFASASSAPIPPEVDDAEIDVVPREGARQEVKGEVTSLANTLTSARR